MKNRHRKGICERRFQNEKFLNKTRRIARLSFDVIKDFISDNKETMEKMEHWIKRTHKNRKRCSCRMCGNYRKNGKGDAKYTKQELINKINFEEETDEQSSTR